MLLVSFYNPWKQKIWAFLFSGGVKIDQWQKMGQDHANIFSDSADSYSPLPTTKFQVFDNLQ